MMPSARAASVPGRMAIHQSLFCAVLHWYGSMVTILAPALRAWCMIVHRCMLVTLVLEPQLMRKRDCRAVSGSMTARVPSVISQPAAPAVAQMVRSSSDAPSRWKKRRSRLEPCSFPIVPA
jgi:hypothetical protein